MQGVEGAAAEVRRELRAVAAVGGTGGEDEQEERVFLLSARGLGCTRPVEVESRMPG